MWVVLAVLSAICLGFYDVSKKQSLTGNSVFTVLLASILCSSAILLPFLVLSRISPEIIEGTPYFVPRVNAHTHMLILMKSALVLASWIFAYFAMKYLPITLVTPINATRPMWTLLGAVLLFHEHLNGWQWAGVTVALASFYAFSVVGQKEGIHYKHNPWIYSLLLGVLLGAMSGLYDKYLMRSLDHNAVQVYYTLYQSALMGLIWAVERKVRHVRALDGFQFRWWIVGIAVFLVLSDFVYLLALSNPDSLISVVSTIRRSGVLVSFAFGALVLRDHNPREKAVCLVGVLVGMILLLIGSL